MNGKVGGLVGLPTHDERDKLSRAFNQTAVRHFDEANLMLAAPARAESVVGDVPSDVLELCARLGNLDHLQTAVRLAFEHFKLIKNLEFRVQIDPDSGEERAIIDLTIDGEINKALASQHAFDAEWVRTVPTSQQDTIRLLIGFV